MIGGAHVIEGRRAAFDGEITQVSSQVSPGINR
jgi:hypothetical protein